MEKDVESGDGGRCGKQPLVFCVVGCGYVAGYIAGRSLPGTGMERHPLPWEWIVALIFATTDRKKKYQTSAADAKTVCPLSVTIPLFSAMYSTVPP